MKVERKLNGEYVLFISEKEIKKAFSSEDNYIRFRNRINDLLQIYHAINYKSNK